MTEAHDSTAIPWLVYAAPCVMFPLMALFIWLDICRYRNYLPLFLAGKCVSIAALLVWFIVSRQVTMFEGLSISSGVVLIELVLLSGDLLSIAAVLLIARNALIEAETSVFEETAGAQVTDGEEN
ncbi:MAG: hypothetical protein LBU82_03870 [Treponema sp.]|jgi:hypothetical protein|nr:hypothetical protein [Treponema sp.]